MGKTRFTQADVTRAAKGAAAAGLRVMRFEIDQMKGKLVVFTSAEPENNADAALEEWERTHGAH